MPRRKKEEPVLVFNVNWNRLRRIFLRTLELIPIYFLRLLTYLVKEIYDFYVGIKVFAQSNVKGIWVIGILFVFSVMIGAVSAKLFLSQRQNVLLRQSIEELNKKHDDSLIESEARDNELQDLKEELEQKSQQIETFKNRSSLRLDFDTVNLIATYSDVNKLNTHSIECLVARESGGRTLAVGDNGAAVGVAQYHLGTFLSHRRQMGLTQEDLRTNKEESIKTMTWAIANGYGPHWTSWGGCS